MPHTRHALVEVKDILAARARRPHTCAGGWEAQMGGVATPGGGVRELAMEISLTSLGSSQIFRLPHFSTEAARRFWSFRETILKG